MKILRAIAISYVALFFLLMSPMTFAAAKAPRAEIPISQTRLSDGTIRYSVPVSIGGGAPIEAMLDTGSFGLRVLKRALAQTHFEDSGITRDYSYASKVVFHGSLASAVITIGDATTGAPAMFQAIQSVGCTQGFPKCPASRVKPQDYGIGGNGLPREGFDAILGISMCTPDAPKAAVNPLTLMGNQAWIVILPLPGDQEPGKLIINPDANDRKGFETKTVPRVAAENGKGKMVLGDRELPAALTGAADGQSTHIDSGDFKSVEPFYRFAVLYDLKNLKIGVKARLVSLGYQPALPKAEQK